MILTFAQQNLEDDMRAQLVSLYAGVQWFSLKSIYSKDAKGSSANNGVSEQTAHACILWASARRKCPYIFCHAVAEM